MHIYRRIRDLREEKGKTQKEIAAILNLKQPHYYRYEKGVLDPPTEMLSTLADYYETSTDYILGRTDERKPYSKSPSN